MGDKSNKKRPGREAPKSAPPRFLGVSSRNGLFAVLVDTHTGDLAATGDHTGLRRPERDRITREVIDLLVKFGWVPKDPLEVRDFLFT
jgi:hypothetical protein